MSVRSLSDLLTSPVGRLREESELFKPIERSGAGCHERVKSFGGAVAVRELPMVREEFGFRRTECACAFCKAPCRHLPGALDPSDLPRLCPPGKDVFAWA